jgi:anti-sigma B factor antagonist
MPLKIDTREASHVTILDIHGRIILGPEIGALRTAVHDLVAQGRKKIILNLAEVDYLLHVTKLYTVFDIKDDEFTAVKSFDYFFAK